MDRKIPFYFLESESFHNDDTYDTLNEPKHENATEVTFLSLTGKKKKKISGQQNCLCLRLSVFIFPAAAPAYEAQEKDANITMDTPVKNGNK